MNPITIETTVSVPVEKAWRYWNDPAHIPGWAFASSDWEALPQTNDLRVGGAFKTRMQAKDGSAGFDFEGEYTEIEEPMTLAYVMDDGRKVHVTFTETAEGVHIVQTFDPEKENPEAMQRAGWQAFLDNFKSYAERQ